MFIGRTTLYSHFRVVLYLHFASKKKSVTKLPGKTIILGLRNNHNWKHGKQAQTKQSIFRTLAYVHGRGEPENGKHT